MISVPRVVLDTNVVLDWLVFANPGVAPIFDAIRQRKLHWLASEPMRGELALVLRRGGFAGRSIDSEHALTLLEGLVEWCPPVPPLPLPRPRCMDASDQMFIDLALHGQARWLLSRDRAVLKLARKLAPLGVAVMKPEAWQLPA